MKKKIYKYRIGHLYGNYSFGSLRDYLFSKKGLNETKLRVLRDLKSSNITLNKLKKYHIMDVGTGRQAYSFLNIGAKAIDHYDISKEHVKSFNNFLKGKRAPITSTNVDLCEHKLPSKKFDYVYLSGIVHHFKNTAVGLKNCAQAVKVKGKIWLHIYRSGTFHWLALQMIRELIEFKELEKFFLSFALIFDDGNTTNEISSSLMDDLFVPSLNLYPISEYEKFMECLGFEISGEANTKPKGKLNLYSAHHTANYAFKRVRDINIQTVDTDKLLTPKNNVNQLDINFQKDKDAIKAINLYYELKDDLKKPKNTIVKFSLIIALHRLDISKNSYLKKTPPRNSKLLIDILNSIKKNLS